MRQRRSLPGAAALFILVLPALAAAQGLSAENTNALLEALMSRGQRCAVQVRAHTRMDRAGKRGAEGSGGVFTITNIGSGVRFNAANRVLTAYSVIADADSLDVQVGGRILPAALMGIDRYTDLALLSVNGLLSSNAPLPVSQTPLRAGDLVLLADPHGEGITMVGGHVVTADAGDLVFTDLKAYEGVSGAPLLNTAGEIAGVVTFAYEAEAGSGISRAVAVTAAEATRIVDDLEQFGRVRRGYFGATADDSMTDRVQLDSVVAGSPAEAAGLRAGDVVTAYGGRPVHDHEELRAMVNATVPGTAVPLAARRDTLKMDLIVVLGDREEQAPLQGERGVWPGGESETATIMRWRMLLDELEDLLSMPGFDANRPEMLPLIDRLRQEMQQVNATRTSKPPPR